MSDSDIEMIDFRNVDAYPTAESHDGGKKVKLAQSITDKQRNALAFWREMNDRA